MTDEDLAKIAWAAWCRAGDDDVTLLWDASAGTRAIWMRVARAVRAALESAVEPLAPGDTVTIPDESEPGSGIQINKFLKRGNTVLTAYADEAIIPIGLDRAGLDALELACRRARAAMEGE